MALTQAMDETADAPAAAGARTAVDRLSSISLTLPFAIHFERALSADHDHGAEIITQLPVFVKSAKQHPKAP